MSEPTKPAPQEIQFRIEIDDQTAQGAYSNLAIVNHSPGEFVLDFIFMQPQQPKGKIRSRVITSPLHFKRLIAAMQENLARYEKSYGVIDVDKLPEPPEPSIMN